MTNCPTNLRHAAERLGVTVRIAAVPEGLWGIYDKRHHLITVKPGLGHAQRISTLAHELGHAHYGHHGHHPKHEHLANKWAARHLLTFEGLMAHSRETLDTGALAANLNVMPWVIESFVNTLTAGQVVEIMNHVASVHA